VAVPSRGTRRLISSVLVSDSRGGRRELHPASFPFYQHRLGNMPRQVDGNIRWPIKMYNALGRGIESDPIGKAASNAAMLLLMRH